VDDLDDEEVSLGSMDEEDFGDELEEEGGAFVDLGGDDDEEGEEGEGRVDSPLTLFLIFKLLNPVTFLINLIFFPETKSLIIL